MYWAVREDGNFEVIDGQQRTIAACRYINKEFSIDVSKTKEIPADYKGVMGVPVTFLDKYNPEQFEIIGHVGSVGADGVYSFANAIYIKGKKCLSAFS